MPIFASGKIHGKVCLESQGDGGFGYDKIFYIDNPTTTDKPLSTTQFERVFCYQELSQSIFFLLGP